MRLAILPAIGLLTLGACAPEPGPALLSPAQMQRCMYEARRGSIYTQGAILGALQNIELRQMCERTAVLENREAVFQRLQLTEAQSGTPLLRARLGGMAEACGMPDSILGAYRTKQGALSDAEWQTGRRLGTGATGAECQVVRASVTQLTGP
jgi:hypothetical protein